MATETIVKGGVDYIHINASSPRELRDLAREQGESMSRVLVFALQIYRVLLKGDAIQIILRPCPGDL